MSKRCFDMVAASCGLLLLIPLLLWFAFRIRHEDGGPVFYRGERIGLSGEPFSIFKFRTMVVNAERLGGSSTADDDPRITRIGKFLRRYKLDELPQLINVLKGDMSIVGPRPEIRSEVETYSPEWKIIFSVRPGITDLSSIEFHNEGEIIANSGFADAHEAYRNLIQPRKLELQRQYVMSRSILLDMAIIFKTVLVIAGYKSNKKRGICGNADTGT
jgi:lipopolysaccharide/colanic/teichoic acid biosynthesis glycosyltransferase